MEVVCEVSEAVEVIKKKYPSIKQKEELLAEELADIFIRLADFIGEKNLSKVFTEALFKKIAKNYNREYRHGKDTW